MVYNEITSRHEDNDINPIVEAVLGVRQVDSCPATGFNKNYINACGLRCGCENWLIVVVVIVEWLSCYRNSTVIPCCRVI